MRKALTGIPDGGTPPVDERVFHAEMNLTLIPLTGLLALPKTSLDEALEHPDRARGKLLRVTGVVTEVQNQLGSTIGWLIGGERERVVFFFTTPTKDAVKVTPDSLVVRFAGVFAQTLRKTGTDGRPLKVVVLVGRFESPEPLPSETDVKLWDGLGLRDSGFTYPEPPQPEVVSFDTLRRLAETGMPFGKPYKVCAFYYPNDMPQFCKHNGSYCEEYLAVGDDFLTGSDEKRRLYDRRNKNGCFEVRMFRGGELRITGLL